MCFTSLDSVSMIPFGLSDSKKSILQLYKLLITNVNTK